jgi:hypothetical protein
MAFIYRRAREALVWLGPHGAPTATRVQQWLSHLIREEYWKCAWIIQEIGMATSIRVHPGRTSNPWDEFVALFKSHYHNQTSDPAVDRIHSLETLRHLSSLLDTFRDCFCAVPHDRIYAFIGMANDHLHGFMPVDYGRSLFHLYEEL